MNTETIEIPNILLHVVPFLQRNASSIPHPVKSISESLFKVYNQLNEGNCEVSLEEFDVQEVTTLLEKYLKEREPPLLSDDISLKLIQCTEESNDEIRRKKLQQIINILPVTSACIFDYIIHFAVSLFHSNMKTLNPIALARFFLPLLFRKPPLELIKSVQLVLAVKELITHYDEIFINISYPQKLMRDELNGILLQKFKNPDDLHSHIKQNSRGIKILSLDGGGIRGLVLVKILCLIAENLFGNSDIDGTNKLLSCFDLICGTSTGGVLAVALASGYSLNRARESYFNLASIVFRPYSYISGPYRSLRYCYNGDYYDSTLLRNHFKDDFGLQDFNSIKKSLFLTSTDATSDKWRTSLIRNYENPRSPFYSLPDVTIPDALRITSAAPTYFAPVKLEDRTFIDGGMTANNPTELAIFEAHHQWPDSFIELILSIGTGVPEDGKGNVNVIGLIKGIINIATSSEQIHRRVEDCVTLLQPMPQYFRFSPPGVGSVPLDESDIKVLQEMENKTVKYIESHKEDIEHLLKLLRVSVKE